MKTRLAVVVSMVSFACGVDAEGDLSATEIGTESRDLMQSRTPAETRVPIALVNPEANDGLDPSGVGYPGWSASDAAQGYVKTRIAYDEVLNSNVFNISTYDSRTTKKGNYSMGQLVRLDAMSAEAREAISEGYPIECQAALNVSYEREEETGNLEMRVYSLDSRGHQIDIRRRTVSTENHWQTTSCGPIASAGMASLVASFSCVSAVHCKIDKVKCDVVKRAGFERFKPVGGITLPVQLPQF